MSRTFKDKPYHVLKREALEHGYTYLHTTGCTRPNRRPLKAT